MNKMSFVKNLKQQKSLTRFIDLPLIIGAIISLLTYPITLAFLSLVKLIDLIDRGFKGMPRSGLIFRFCRWVNQKCEPFTEKYVVHKSDSYIIGVIIFLGLGIPLIVILSGFYVKSIGYLPIWLGVGYHCFRLGPGLVTFALIQSLSHKEGHAGYQQFKGPFAKILGKCFSLWIGIFYGILPYSFSLGHTVNHHKYNNSKLDVIATSDQARDSLISYTRYVFRFFLYSSNISVINAFYNEKRYKECLKLSLGILQLIIFGILSYRVSTSFFLCFVVYPFLENVSAISCYNWTWHAFIDPDDPSNDYVNSITILNGNYNMIDRDLHVVHHSYPGVHWSKYSELYAKDQDNYTKYNASIFKQTHATELFFLIIFKNYKAMANKFIFSKPMTEDEKITFIKRRLQSITWGPNQNCGFIEKKQS